MVKSADKPRATKNHDLRESRAGKAPDSDQTQPTRTDDQSRRAGTSDGKLAEEGNDEGNDDVEADELDVEKDVDDIPDRTSDAGQGPSGVTVDREGQPAQQIPSTLQQLLDVIGI